MEKESLLFTPYKLGPVTLRNRTIRSAAFESMGRAYGPTEQLKNYHVSVARGGVGMTTLAYAAVCRSGLSFEKQLWLRPEIVPGLRDITDAVNFIRKADVLIVGGTSLAVYPAAGLLRYYEGRKLALVNMGATSYDESADLLIREKIGKVFSEV